MIGLSAKKLREPLPPEGVAIGAGVALDRDPEAKPAIERQLGLDDCDNYFRRSTSQREEQYQDILRLQNDEVS